MTLEDVYETLVQQSMIFIREPTPPPIKPIPGQAIRIPKNRKNGSHPASSLRRSKSSNQLYKAQSRYKSQDPSVNGNGHGHDTEGPFVPPKHYEVRFDREKVKAYLRNWEAKGYLKLKPEKLQWTPYLLTRGAIEEGKVKRNGVVPNGVAESETGSRENSEVVINGRHSEPAMTPGEKPSVSPVPSALSVGENARAQDQDEGGDEEGELPVLKRRTRSSKRESTQTPRRTRRQESMEAEMESAVTRRLRSQSNQLGTQTPTPSRKSGEGEGDDPRSVRRRNRMARKEEGEAEEEEGPGTKVQARVGEAGKRETSTTPRKRRRVDSESASKGCESVGADQVGSAGEAKAEEEEGCAGMKEVDVDVKYEDAGTPLTSLTSPSDETVYGMEVPLLEKRAGLPVSDERSTLEMEMEVGDEDAEGSDEDAEGSAEVECSI